MWTVNHVVSFKYQPCFEKIDTRLTGIEQTQFRILSLLNKIKMTQEELITLVLDLKCCSSTLAFNVAFNFAHSFMCNLSFITAI